MEKILDRVNSWGQRWWLSRNPVKHTVADGLYNIYCFGFMIKNRWPQEKIVPLIKSVHPDATEQQLQDYLKDINHCWVRYGIAPDEYFMYGIEYNNHEQRKEWISEVEHLKYGSILNDRANGRIIHRKYQAYLALKDYYKRDAMLASEVDEAFLQKHPRFMLKLEHASKGDGIQIVSAEDYPDLDAFKAAIRQYGDDYVCEELIEQDPRMAAWHPQSINTVRIITIEKEGKIHYLGGVLRTGRGGICVDNVAKGGTMAAIDCETGYIATVGKDKLYNFFEEHPDTHVRYKGTKIPEWEALCSFIEDVVHHLPEGIRYVGWDFALSTQGWVVVEGNNLAQITPQMAGAGPLKKRLLQLIYPEE